MDEHVPVQLPWNDIEKRYAALFTNKKGNVTKPLRQALGACIIRADYSFSDEETALQIQGMRISSISVGMKPMMTASRPLTRR